jgi:hypothetical protein
MKLKIIHRSSSIWNIIVFVLLSFFFLFAVTAIINNKSGFDLTFLRFFLVKEDFFLAIILISSLSVFFHKKISKMLFLSCSIIVIGKVSLNLYEDFDKFIVTMLFFFILSSYYYFTLLQIELRRAYLSPNYSIKELFDPMLYKIPCAVESLDNKDKKEELDSYLLNWDDESCFISCKWQDIPKDKNVNFVVEYNGYTFSQKAKIVSFKKDIGIGLVFMDEEKKSLFDWAEFIKIINDLGFTVRYLK